MTIESYNPLIPPRADAWLALDESVRVALVEAWHDRHADAASRGDLHASMHVVIENQVAMGDEVPVRRKLRQLMAQGLNRHEAIHAIASVLINHIHRSAGTGDRAGDRGYFAALARLNARTWRRRG